MRRQTFDPEKFQLTIVRYKKHGHVIELAIDPDEAFRMREGHDVDLDDVLQSEDFFKDAQKGERASPESLEQCFPGKNVEERHRAILLEGDIHYTAQFLKEKREDKLKQILHYVREHAMDGRTKLPIPMQRLENALEQVKFHVDPFKPVAEQANKLVPLFKPLFPIVLSLKQINISAQQQYAGKVQAMIRKEARVIHESWNNDGSFVATVELSAAQQQRLINLLESSTHGGVQFNEL